VNALLSDKSTDVTHSQNVLRDCFGKDTCSNSEAYKVGFEVKISRDYNPISCTLCRELHPAIVHLPLRTSCGFYRLLLEMASPVQERLEVTLAKPLAVIQKHLKCSFVLKQ
jgi:hypothetical protein